MKNMKKLIVLTAILLVGLTSIKAQVSATAIATATIITPITIAKTSDMNFGNIAASSNLGTVVLTPSSNRTVTGGATLQAVIGTVSAAAFNITGLGTSSFSVTLPITYTLTKQSGSATMIVNTFTSTPSSIGTLVGGAATVLVGATLNVSALQLAGTYTNNVGFPVTVNYN